MDEELMNITTEDKVEVPDPEIVETDVDIESEVQDLAATETTEVVEVEQTEEVYIDISESIGWVGGDSTKHYSMAGRDEPNQHPIEAISGLRDELNEIEALQTVFSDKVGFANYYKWLDGAYDETGYFVSIEPGTSEIKICDGENIFGVTVASAGFVGGQDGVTLDYINGVRDAQGAPRDNSYGLVVTSGFADVRCELDVQVGDCVVSNARGLAKKSASNYGYRVLAKENKDGIEYAVILLGVQADKTNAIGEEINGLTNRVKTNEQNIASVINLANKAYNKSADSANVSEEALKKALEALLNSEHTADDMEKLQESMSSTAAIVAQARAIAESAVNSAESMRETAVKEANEALAGTTKLREEFAGMEKQITDIDGRVVIVTQKTTDNGRAISGIQSKADKESARIDLLTSWQSDTKTAMARIEQKADENGAYIKSTVSNMDKYSVGPHSQAYGFTLEQAQSVLEVGMIYAPTDSVTEYYEYKDGEETKKVSRSFTPGYLYQWDYIGWVGDGTGWKTVGESQSVVFTTETPIANDSVQYWYTNGDPVSDTYEAYTLYKWTTYETKLEKEYESDEDIISIAKSSWVPVATLAGNSQNRVVSQIRQDANSIVAEVVDAYGAVAGFGTKLSKTEAKVNSIASWPTDGGKHNMAILEQKADDNGAYMVLATVRDVDGKPGIEELGGARIVLSDDATLGSYIQMDADHINFGSSVTITNAGDDVMNVADKFIVSRDGRINIRDGYITWASEDDKDGVNSPEITDIDGLDEYLTQLDGRIQSYSQSSDPAESWSDEDKKLHIGDLWFNPEDGLTKRWNGAGWEKVTDSDLATLAQKKAQIFTSEPKPPYYLKDLWVEGEDGDIRHCIFERPSNNDLFNKSDWALSSKYTDDTRADNAYNLAEDAKEIGDLLVEGIGFQKTEIGDNYIISPSIAGGYLNIASESGQRVLIDPYNLTNNDYIFQVYNGDKISVGIDKDGNAVFDGTVYAGGGEIGGNTIDATGLHITNGEISIGKSFSVTSSGVLTATGADITGKITATSLELTSGATIPNTAVTGLSSVATSGDYGDLSNKPTIPVVPTNLSEFVNDLDIEVPDEVKVSSSTNDTTGIVTTTITVGDKEYTTYTSKESNYVFTNVGIGTKTSGGSSKYFCISKEGLLEAHNAIIYGTVYAGGGEIGGFSINSDKISSGTIGSSGSVYMSTTNTAGVVAGAPLNTWRLAVGSNFGVNSSGKLYASGAKIDGEITAGTGDIGGNIIDENGLHITKGDIIMPCRDDKQVEIGTDGGVRVIDTLGAMFIGKFSCAQYSANVMRFGYSTSLGGAITNTNQLVYDAYSDPYVMITGTWSGNNSGSIVSDVNMKNHIEVLDDRYEIMFDNLTSRRFLYNDGTSNRYHTGYIAQEVQSAIKESGLSEKDFAALCTFRRGEENEFMGLRYEEFISLNTWQIQKLKARVAELEAKIATLT